MKHNLLLLPLCASITLIGMQRPISLSEQFMAATERGDIQLVVNMLNQNPSLLNDIRNYYNYATEPILKFAKRNPGKTAEYMQIARFLVNNGARIHPSALKELETFEQSYRAPVPTYTQPRPTYQQPIPAPAPVQPRPQPYMPAGAPSQPAPVPQPLSKATEEKYQNLLKAIGETNPNEVKKILSQIDPKELSSSQQQELFSKADTIFLYIFNYAQLSVAKEIIKLLLAKGWAPSPSIKQRIDLYLQNQGLGNRSAWIKTSSDRGYNEVQCCRS